MLVDSTLILAGLALLIYGADRFVVGAASIARHLGVQPLIIGLTIVGIATSAPEVLVGAVAAFNGKTILAIGNAIGSNIANVGLVIGVTALSLPVITRSPTIRREYLSMCAATAAAFAVLVDGHLSRIDGLILIACLLGALGWIVYVARSSPEEDPLAGEYATELEEGMPRSPALSWLLLGAGLLLLLGGAELLVRGAVAIAAAFGVSELVIGLTIVAIGTSLPELAASIMSVIKNEADIAVGNVIGSNMFNMLMVLGVPAVIGPTPVSPEALYRDFPVMVFLTLLMGWMLFTRSRGRFDRAEGAVLFLCFAVYQYWLFLTISA